MTQIDYVVAKPFNSSQRRFPVGAPVLETDDLSPHAFDDLKRRKWIVSNETKTGAAAMRAGSQQAAIEDEANVAAALADLQREWETAALTGAVPEGNWAVKITDDNLFGRVTFHEGAAIGVYVPGEEDARFYRIEDIDLIARTVAGKYSDHGAGPRPPRRTK